MKNYIYFILLFNSVMLSAQNPIKENFTLSGLIKEKGTGERIPFATVQIKGSSLGTISDVDGYFTLEKTPSDTSTLIFKYLGYQTKEIKLTPSKENKQLEIHLEKQSLDLEEVVIIASREEKAMQKNTEGHVIRMSPSALKVLPNLGEKDVMRSFQLMPGVSAANESNSGMYVRGGTPDQNLILYDGFTVYYVDHLHGFYSAFNSNAIKDVQLYKGGFESKYGGRLSSVTELTAKDGNANAYVVGGEINLLSTNIYAELPLMKNITTMFAFRRSYQGYLYNKINDQEAAANETQENTNPTGFDGINFTSRRLPSSMTLQKPDSYFYDFNGKLTWSPGKKDIFSISFFNGKDWEDNTSDFQLGGSQFGFGGMFGGNGGFGGPSFGQGQISSLDLGNADFKNAINTGLSFRWAHRINSKLSSSFLAGYSDYYSIRDQTREIDYMVNDTLQTTKSGNLESNNLTDFSLKSDWRYSINEKYFLEFGAFGTNYDIHYTYSQTDTATILDKADKANLGGIYLQNRIKLIQNRLSIVPGIRATWFQLTDKIYYEPRLSSSFKLDDQWTINMATGLFYQFANRLIREDVMNGNNDFWILSDGKDIPVSNAIHYNAGINYNIPDYQFSIEGYYKKYDDISEYTLRFERQNGRRGFRPNFQAEEQTVNEQFFSGYGYATGLEFLVQKKTGKFNGWISYTIAEVKNLFPEQSSN